MVRLRPVLETWEIEPYACLITVALGATLREVIDFLESEGCSPEPCDRARLRLKRSAAITYPVEDGRVVIRFKERVPTIREMVHEGLHATSHILTRADMPFTEDSEEGWAYLLDHIVGRLSDLVDSTD